MNILALIQARAPFGSSAGDTGGSGDQFERAQPFRVIVDIGHDDQFVGAGFRDQRIEAGTNRIGRSDDGDRELTQDLHLFERRPIRLDIVDRWFAQAALIASAKIAAGDPEAEFYKAKLATAKFYSTHVLSQGAYFKRQIIDGSGDVMTVTEDQFELDRKMAVTA